MNSLRLHGLEPEEAPIVPLKGEPWSYLVASKSRPGLRHRVDVSQLINGALTADCECEASTFKPSRECSHAADAKAFVTKELEFNRTTAPTPLRPEPEPVVKTCRRCGIAKPASELKRDLRNGDGWSSFCKECHKAASIAWQKANPDKVKAARRARYQRTDPQARREKSRKAYDPSKAKAEALQKLYRLSIDDYRAMFAAQNGACAICGIVPTGRALSVDHDHLCCPKTPTCGNCNRGLLCSRCNLALDVFLGTSPWAYAARQYIEERSRGR